MSSRFALWVGAFCLAVVFFIAVAAMWSMHPLLGAMAALGAIGLCLVSFGVKP